jgi:hypothetical protein
VAAPVHRAEQSRRDETLQMPAEGTTRMGRFGCSASMPSRRLSRTLRGASIACC